MASGLPTIAARIDRLPASRVLWGLVGLLSFGAFFEIYDIYLSAPLSLGLLASGVFHAGKAGLLGLSDQASFIAVTFVGLWLGTVAFSTIADRLGRRPIFTAALVWYALATCAMGIVSGAPAILAWRFVASIGVGVELVAIDCYLAELAPKAWRGRAFAVSASIQFLSVPLVAVLAWRLIPGGFLGVAGWRWLAFLPAIAAVGAWRVRLALPESPRWLENHGRMEEAERVLAGIEERVIREIGRPLPPPAPETPPATVAATPALLRPPWRGRAVLLVIFHLFQTLGYYGFANWLPTLLVSEGVTLTASLGYGVTLALIPPLAPLAFMLVADRFERKWLIVAGALTAGVFGLGLSRMTQHSNLLMFTFVGAAVAGGAALMSVAYHAYQSELFPTAIRARAVGFVYSFSRLSAAATAYLIAWTLEGFGGAGVFILISAAMVVVAIVIALWGPRTRGRALEAI